MKKYKSFFEVYDKIAFHNSDPDLSQKIDEILYVKKPARKNENNQNR